MTLQRNTFEQQIEAARQRLENLQQHAGESPEQTAMAMEALEELSNALEELHVAGEELRQQNDELAASRQAVEAERQRYEELFELAPDGYLVTDPEGVIQTANRAAAALLGVRQDFLTGKPLLVFVADVFAQTGHAAFHTRLRQLQKAYTDKVQDWQLWLQPREGVPFPAEVTVGRVRDADGRLTGLRWLLRDITRRKRTEEALQLSEAHYRAIVEDQTEFILRFLPEGSLTFVNGAYCRYLGKTHEQVLERNLTLLTPVCDRQEIGKRLAALTPETPAATYELRVELPGGQMSWQQWTTRALYDDGGNLVEYQSVGRDVTERKQMEDAQAFLLQCGYSSEDFFQSLARYLAESLGMDYVCIDRLLGDELTAQTVAIYFDGKFEDNVAYALKDTPCGDVVGQTICCFPREVRRLFPQDVVLQEMVAESYVGVTLWSSQGRPIGLIAVIGRHPLMNPRLAESVLKLVAVRAASELERRQAEQALQQSHRRLALLNSALQTLAATLDLDRVLVAILEEMRRLLDADSCLVWLVDPETGELICRQSAGLHSESARGWRLATGQGMAGWVASNGKSLIVPDTLKDERYLKDIEQAIGFAPRSILSVPMWVHQRVMGVLQVLDVDPNRHTETDLGLAEPLAAAAAAAIVNAQLYERAQREIAERKRAEETLHQQALELEARNAELDAFDHTVAHDLKNPLSLVVGLSEELESDYTGLPREELQWHLHTLARSARTMGRIIDELLLLAGVRKAQAQVGPLDMADIVDEARLRLSDLIEERQAEIVLPEASAWPMALGHAEWIVEVWANYLSNSIKYGGQPPCVKLGAEAQPDGMVRFWVRDNGHGLSTEEQARLFTPFTRLNQVRAKGHGLGLSIVRRIVEKLGGQVGVESHSLPGQGSCFFFTLPGAVSPTTSAADGANRRLDAAEMSESGMPAVG